MRTAGLLAAFTLASFLVMVVVDYYLGERAEFLNAFSVLERLLGNDPSAGESLIARSYGASGELTAVVVFNTAIGSVFTLLARIPTRKKEDAA